MAFTLLFAGLPFPSLDYPVGDGARNVRDDVMLVQVWLGNIAKYSATGAAGAREVSFLKRIADVDIGKFQADGVCGHQTRVMLRAFVHAFAPVRDPGGKAWVLPFEVKPGTLELRTGVAKSLWSTSSDACALLRVNGPDYATVKCAFAPMPSMLITGLANRRSAPAHKWKQ